MGLAANGNIKSVLELAGVKDMWTFTKGRTRDRYNMAIATFEALKSLNMLKNTEAIKA